MLSGPSPRCVMRTGVSANHDCSQRCSTTSGGGSPSGGAEAGGGRLVRGELPQPASAAAMTPISASVARRGSDPVGGTRRDIRRC
jgi:hypothetical protein